MHPISKIMVAVDESNFSPHSVQYAFRLAQVLEAHLLLVSIYNQRDYYTILNTIGPYDPKLCEQVFEDHMSSRRQYVDNLLEQTGVKDIAVQKIVRMGVPYQELLAVIDEEKPDLLVMSTKGRSNLGDTLVGSCARKMYRLSPIPVLSLRPELKQ